MKRMSEEQTTMKSQNEHSDIRGQTCESRQRLSPHEGLKSPRDGRALLDGGRRS